MTYLLLIVPWVLTVAALMYIMVQSRHEDDDEDDDEYMMDDDETPETVRVAVYEDKAYWVHGNVFYQAEVTREPDFATAQPVDTMKLNQKELSKLLKILDDLKEESETE
jgi:hypothetical protein